MKRIIQAVAAFAVGIAVAAGAAAQAPEKKKITIAVGGKNLFYYLPLTVAERNGYFKEEGLEVEIPNFAGGAQALEKPKLTIAVGGKNLLYYLPLTVAERKGYFKDEDAQPFASSLKCEPERSTEKSSEHCVSPEPEECVPGTELEAIRRHAKLGVNISYVEGCLKPGETEAHQRAVN